MKLTLNALYVSFLVCLATLPTLAHAQGGGIGNGGDLNEINLLKLYDRITNFMGTSEGKETFPKLNQQLFRDLRSKILISVVDGTLKDYKGQTRSELNFWNAEHTIASIQFSREALKTYTGDEPELYVIILHSALNLMKIELAKDVWSEKIKPSSIYTYSSRILKFVTLLNADGFLLPNLHVDCNLLYWPNQLRFVRASFSFDPFNRKMSYSHREFQYPKGFWSHPDMKDKAEVLNKRRSVTRPFLAQNLIGNVYTVAYVDPLHPKDIRTAKIMLPLIMEEGAPAFVEVNAYPYSVDEHPSSIDLLSEVQAQSAPGEPVNKVYSCNLTSDESSGSR